MCISKKIDARPQEEDLQLGGFLQRSTGDRRPKESKRGKTAQLIGTCATNRQTHGTGGMKYTFGLASGEGEQ